MAHPGDAIVIPGRALEPSCVVPWERGPSAATVSGTDTRCPAGGPMRNLDILRRYLPDAGIDLVYLDPPWDG
jgi:hypothetical protein